jgi:hypothetical protein
MFLLYTRDFLNCCRVQVANTIPHRSLISYCIHSCQHKAFWMLCREIVGTTVKQLKTSILFIVMQCCFSQVTFLNYSIVFYNCCVPELSCLQDANSSTEALNRLQGVILYSSPGEGIRLEYPAIKNSAFYYYI